MSCFCQHSWLSFVKERELILLHRGKYSHTQTHELYCGWKTHKRSASHSWSFFVVLGVSRKNVRVSVTRCCRAQMEIVSGQRCFLPEVTLVGMLLLQHVNSKSPNYHRVFWPIGSFLGEISAPRFSVCSFCIFLLWNKDGIKGRWALSLSPSCRQSRDATDHDAACQSQVMANDCTVNNLVSDQTV